MTRYTKLLPLLLAAVILTTITGTGQAAAPANKESGNFTFFLISDSHLGTSNPKATPPVTPEQIELKVREVVSNMVAISKKPFSARGPFKSIYMSTPGPVKGIFIAGDITDHGTAEEFKKFTEIFPATGVPLRGMKIPVYPCIGNHDGPLNGPMRQGLIEQNRAKLKSGMISSLSENGVHYAVKIGNLHLISAGLYPADVPDAQTPFKFGGGTVGGWNDPQGSLTFLTNYLHKVVGKSGQPVIIIHHYGFDPFSAGDWYWWTPALRRAYYNAIKDFNILAIFHGHDHAARHYYWPDPKTNPAEVKSLFGETPPADLKSFDVFSAGGVCWVFRVQSNKLLAMHHEAKEWTTSPEKMAVKSLMPAGR